MSMDVFWHEHSILERESHGPEYCKGCYEKTSKISYTAVRVYACDRCQFVWHTSCVPSSPENINHPCHPSHPLEFLMQGPPYADGKCNICCGEHTSFIYHCKLCDFSIDMKCVKDPLPLTVDHPKCHDHALTLMGREVTFTCNACGTHGERNPYVCLPCSLMFHYDCIDLPHVININRHEHRVSHAYPLTPRDRICQICRQNINWRYGAYSCTKCPDLSVHSRCATRKDVWDGVELEEIPEEELDIVPFKVIDEEIINHFSHEEHNLFLIEDVIIDNSGEAMRCEGCSRPISFERYYNCMECDFMLHEECANLPLQKRHALSTRVLSLSASKKEDDIIFFCAACERLGTGFRYSDGDEYHPIVLDVHCASLSWFRHRKIHPHTLFLTTLDKGDCVGCDKSDTYVLGCIECEYFLDFKCATLPIVIKHRCDDHYLFLSSGEKATGKYWCEICEAETDPQKWFYTCHDCGVVCHIDCVVGVFLNINPGVLFMSEEGKSETVLNNQNFRPLCSACGSRCTAPVVYKISENSSEKHYCSFFCFPDS